MNAISSCSLNMLVFGGWVLFLHTAVAFECGVANDANVVRIVGGKPVGYYKYPWFASLHPIGDVHSQVCAGALITTRHVMSAAHCFESATIYKPREKLYAVTLGLYNRCNVSSTAETFDVTKVTIHEKYTTSTNLYDISLLTLNKAAVFMPVCLPAKGAPVVHESKAIVAGFGIQFFKSNAQPCEMLQANVEIYPLAECKKTGIPKPELEVLEKRKTAICAGRLEGGIDTCQGDSGGALLVVHQGRHVQEGIVSFGYGCADENLPGIYTRVASYIDWINRATDGLSSNNKPIGSKPSGSSTGSSSTSLSDWLLGGIFGK